MCRCGTNDRNLFIPVVGTASQLGQKQERPNAELTSIDIESSVPAFELLVRSLFASDGMTCGAISNSGSADRREEVSKGDAGWPARRASRTLEVGLCILPFTRNFRSTLNH